MILLISGKMRSGKDTVADYLCGMHGFIKISHADALKQDCYNLIGRPDGNLTIAETRRFFDVPETKKKYRGLLIGVGQLMRDINPDWWVNQTFASIESELIQSDEVNIVVPDCRFENEINYIQSGCKGLLFHHEDASVVTLRMESDHRYSRGAMAEFDEDISETGLDGYARWDYTIQNSGTKGELFDSVEAMISDIHAV